VSTEEPSVCTQILVAGLTIKTPPTEQWGSEVWFSPHISHVRERGQEIDSHCKIIDIIAGFQWHNEITKQCFQLFLWPVMMKNRWFLCPGDTVAIWIDWFYRMYSRDSMLWVALNNWGMLRWPQMCSRVKTYTLFGQEPHSLSYIRVQSMNFFNCCA
jgi:hypothetical protein